MTVFSLLMSLLESFAVFAWVVSFYMGHRIGIGR